jgi:flagellar basal-body rod protein FlgB
MAARPLDPSRPVEIYDTTQSALEKAIVGASARQQAIAENLANVDTPGYQRVDVDFHTTLRNAMASGDLKAATFSPQRDASAQVRADGSTVDADVEAAAQARNGLEYETLVSVSKARIDIIEAAMGR